MIAILIAAQLLASTPQTETSSTSRRIYSPSHPDGVVVERKERAEPDVVEIPGPKRDRPRQRHLDLEPRIELTPELIERFRAGSVKHAFGGALVMTGILSALGSLSLVVYSTNNNNKAVDNEPLFSAAAIVGVGAAIEVLVGCMLIYQGNEGFEVRE